MPARMLARERTQVQMDDYEIMDASNPVKSSDHQAQTIEKHPKPA
jgi:hypothetical protein